MQKKTPSTYFITVMSDWVVFPDKIQNVSIKEFTDIVRSNVHILWLDQEMKIGTWMDF